MHQHHFPRYARNALFVHVGGLSFGFFDSSNRIRSGTNIPEHAYFEFQVDVHPDGCVAHSAHCQSSIYSVSTLRADIVQCATLQGAFATITAAVISGAVAGRIRLWAWCVFIAVWNVLVYCPLARWVFYEDGWLARLGVLDFAGGLVVEMSSGVSAFVLAFWIGPGLIPHGTGGSQPHSVPLVLIGAGLLFFGWFGEWSRTRLHDAT